MKKTFALFIGLLISSLAFSQRLDVKLVEKLTTISFSEMDQFMLEENDFVKFREESDGDIKRYGGTINANKDNAIQIEVLNTKELPLNQVYIFMAKNYKVQRLRKDLIENGYTFKGNNKHGFWAYEKDDLLCLVATNTLSDGARRVMFVNK